ncbi:MAG: hypothetical protein ACOY94_18955 [Bacillota bacterium]
MISPWLVLSLMFGAGGLVTFIMGRRLSRQAPLAWLVQVVGALLMLAAVVGVLAELLA